MNWPIIIIIGTQLLFTISDLLARTYMSKQGFALTTFLSGWFLVYFSIRGEKKGSSTFFSLLP